MTDLTDLPIWAQQETHEEEVARLAGHFLASPRVSQLVAQQTVYDLKAELDDVPKWRLLRRWQITRVAKHIATEAGLA